MSGRRPQWDTPSGVSRLSRLGGGEVMAALRRNASVTWTGSARAGRGIFRVGSRALEAPFTYNSRFKGDSETNPEELLLAAQAGCLTMALAAALKEKQIEPGTIE